MDITHEEIERRMGFHPADTDLKRKAHGTARALMMAATKAVCDLLPAGREKSLYVAEMEGALMRANQSLALNGGPQGNVTVSDLEEILDDFGSAYPGRENPNEPA
jgi:hypothetical protein